MPQQRLSNEEFFSTLTSLLNTATTAHKSSIFLTQKALTPTSEVASSLLVSATDGADPKSRIKIATVVEPADLEAFFAKYAEVCKVGMGSLKKRDRKKRKERLKAKKATSGG